MFEHHEDEFAELSKQIIELGETWRRVAEFMSRAGPEAQPQPPVTILLL
jgi:hypothetical protein